MENVSIKNLKKRYGDLEVLSGVDLEIDKGEFVSFLGPSGCGKTTLLRTIAGLEDVSDGQIKLGNRDITQTPPAKRDIAMVFQNYALYPHMTVRKNMAFGLSLNGIPKAEVKRLVAGAAETLQITSLLDRKPRQLSGGQRQRVAIGRAIVRAPKLFLLDEPLSNLDASLRVSMRVELADLHARLEATMIYVTHDQVEAMTLSDKVVVLDKGVVAQFGTPLELFHTPKSRFVAGFIGTPAMNFFAVGATMSADQLSVTGPEFAKSVSLQFQDSCHISRNGEMTLGIRPDEIEIVEGDAYHAVVRVDLVERLGNESHVHARTATGRKIVIVVSGTSLAINGTEVKLRLPSENCHLFDAQGRALPRRISEATAHIISRKFTEVN